MQVTVSDHAAEPEQYDGHRVVGTDRVRSMVMQMGRRGHRHGGAAPASPIRGGSLTLFPYRFSLNAVWNPLEVYATV